MLKRNLFVFALLMTTAALPARADDLSVRVDQLEEQIKQLTGQVEQLTFQLKQMQAPANKKLGAADTAPALTDQAAAQPAAPLPAKPVAAQPAQVATAAPVLPFKKKLGLQPQDTPSVQGVETIEEVPVLPTAQAANAAPASGETQVAGLAPVAKPLGLGTKTAAVPNDGGYQGKVLVAPGGIENATDAGDAGDASATAQQVSLQPETPDDLFLRSEKALLQLQYADAESGFKDFIAKYPDHNLAGSAEFKLGETYWAEQDYTSSARAYLNSYKKYPKGRRAPDSLLKLGLSFARMGQKDQACATIGSVDTEFPTAVEVKKRAQAEFKREGC
jgi:tol-pal system protein YbgF